MKNIFFTLMILGVFFSTLNCLSLKRNQQNNLTAIRLKFNLPVVQLNGELLNISDSIYVYFFKEVVLYKVPYTFSLESELQTLSTEKKYSYFIYKVGDRYGTDFNSLGEIVGSRQSVDSFLSERAFDGFVGSKFYNAANDRLINITNNNGVFKYTYAPRITSGELANDSTYLFFKDGLKDVKYSLIKELDSFSNLKLFKVKLLYRERFSDTYNIVVPKRELTFEIDTINDDMSQDIIKTLKSYCDRAR